MHSEISGAAGGGEGGLGGEPAKRRWPKDDQINAKLKQFFQKKTEIKPFYSGGKICILSPCHFACQCGPAVNVISTVSALTKKLEEADGSTDSVRDDLVSENGEDMDEDDVQYKASFQILSHLECELDEVTAFDACPSTNLLVTSHKSSLLRVWDLNRKGEIIKTIKSLHHLPIGLLEIHRTRASHSLQRKLKPQRKGSRSSDSEDLSQELEDADKVPEYEDASNSTRNDLMWTTISGAQVKIWELGGNRMSKIIPIKDIASIGYARWDERGKSKRLFVAERNIYVIDGGNGTGSGQQFTQKHSLEGHYSQVTAIEFAGDVMISGGRDKVMILWDMTKEFTRLKTIPLSESVEAMVLMSPNDLYINLSPNDIRHYNVKKNALSKASIVLQDVNEPIVSLYSPLASRDDGCCSSFMAVTHSSIIFEVEPSSPTKNHSELQIRRQYVGCLEEILCIVFWGQGQVAVANNTCVIKVYDLSSGQCEFLRGHKDIVLSLAAREKWLVSGSKDNCVMLWTSDSDKPQVVLEGHLASVTAVCFSQLPCPTSQQYLLFSVSEDNFLKRWNFLQCQKSQLAHDKEIHSVQCSPNGALVITSSRDKTAKIWDAETLGLAGTLKGHKKSVWDARFSPWDQLAATSSADTTIKVWNIVSFTCIQTLQGHLSSVLQIAFVNLGLQLVSTSSDGTFRVWDLKTSTCVSTEECGNDKIWAMTCQPDASVIITGSADSVMTVWEDVTETRVKTNLAKRKRMMEDEQKLSNVIKSGKWEEAFRLAVELDRPFTLLRIIRELRNPSELAPIVSNLTLDLKSQLIDYIKQWNTNTKTCAEAQHLLNSLLKTTPLDQLDNLPTEALIAYTQKHYSRLKTHRQHAACIQYFARKDGNISGS